MGGKLGILAIHIKLFLEVNNERINQRKDVKVKSS